jgi:cystathionine beta-synthase
MPDVLSLIGNTPLIQVTRIDTGRCELFLKLESQNPGGSIKDRVALSMIEAAEREGRIQRGGTLIEATAGNTGLGLGLVAARKGYRLVLVIPDKMSQEKIFHLRALGAEVVMTRSDVGRGHPEYYQDVAERIARATPGAFYVNQFANPANPLAHERTTGPEIWAQTEGRLDAVVCGVGTGGTMAGLGRYFRRVAPHVKMVLADPAGSILAGYVKTGQVGQAGSWLVEGIGEDFIPPVADLSAVSEAFAIPDRESFAAVRELLALEGVLGGSSTGTLLAAALRYCRGRSAPERVVTFVCDSGNKYLSKVFNDYWMADQGFLDRPRQGDLRDLISRPYETHAVITVAPEDTLLLAFGRFKLYDVSQLPVMREDRVVGIIDESDVLFAVTQDQVHFADPVSAHMSTRLKTLSPKAPLDELVRVLGEGYAALVVEGELFFGLITAIDVLNYLRRKLKR